MRHHNKNKKFGRERGQRIALIRSLLRSLALAGHITTTEAKAKAVRPVMEKLVTKAKRVTLANRRAIIAALGDERAADLLIKNTTTRYTSRPGGYLRIVKLGARKGDASPMAHIEFV